MTLMVPPFVIFASNHCEEYAKHGTKERITEYVYNPAGCVHRLRVFVWLSSCNFLGGNNRPMFYEALSLRGPPRSTPVVGVLVIADAGLLTLR